jgi:hypothetical protein
MSCVDAAAEAAARFAAMPDVFLRFDFTAAAAPTEGNACQLRQL